MIIVYINMLTILYKNSKTKLDEAFARVESYFVVYKYEVQHERQQIASYSLQPPQINLHPHHQVKVPPPKIHSCCSIWQHPLVVKLLFLTKTEQVWPSHCDASPPWVVIYAWKRRFHHHGATLIAKQLWLQIRSPSYHHVLLFTQKSLVEERLNPLSERSPRKNEKAKSVLEDKDNIKGEGVLRARRF